MDSEPWTLTARWIFPVSSPPLRHGSLTIDGPRIVSIEPTRPSRPDVDLGEVAIIPGLVNAHTHLDLTGLRGRVPFDGQFTDWLLKVITFRRTRFSQDVEADVRAGLAESVRSGVTLLGDIAGFASPSWQILTRGPIRAVVYYEMLGLRADREEQVWNNFLGWCRDRDATANCRPGVSPHAPYSVRAPLIWEAAHRDMPLAIHLAETKEEGELLANHTGPFLRFLSDLEVWDASGLVANFQEVSRLTRTAPSIAYVHGNYLDPAGWYPSRAVIVYCPRTHAYFGHPTHPFREFLARGVRVALGTDSLASNPDLDLLAEARFLRERFPDVPGETLLRMATLHGAAALGWDDEAGSLAPGKSADLVTIPLAMTDPADPHDHVLRSSSPVRDVLCRGRWLVGGPPGPLS